jgi:hypothetical protein
MAERPDGRLGFMSEGRKLSAEQDGRLLRIVAKLWCQGAVDGHFTSMASINDVRS